MKLNFFSRLYLAITDFRLYPFIVQKEKFITAFAYLLALLVFISLFLSTSMATRVFEWSKDFATTYISKVPDFVIEDGKLIAKENVNFEFNQVRVYMDSSKTINDIDMGKFDSEAYSFSIIALGDCIAVGREGSVLTAIKYSDIKPNTDKMDFFRFYNEIINSPKARLIFTGSLFIGVFIANICVKAIDIIIIILMMLLFLSAIFKIKYKFMDYAKIACYVITLPIIIETIALVFNGTMQDYVYITYYLLMYIYMYYAVRALKLDNIIMTAKSKFIDLQNEEKSKEKSDSTGDKPKEEKNEDNK